MKKSVYLFIILTTILLSCSTGYLNKYVELCGCEVTEHFIASTDNEENSTKEFTFKGSPLFEYGIEKYGFALNMSLLINQDLNIDSLTLLRITIEKGNSKVKSYEFDYYELNRLKPRYEAIHKIAESFVENIYSGDFHANKEYLGFEMENSEYNEIMTSIQNDLEHDYLETKMMSFEKGKGQVYNIFGAVRTKDETLDLFKMQLIKEEEVYKITEFTF